MSLNGAHGRESKGGTVPMLFTLAAKAVSRERDRIGTRPERQSRQTSSALPVPETGRPMQRPQHSAFGAKKANLFMTS